jgi:hypothetical protein
MATSSPAIVAIEILKRARAMRKMTTAAAASARIWVI